MDWLSTPTAGSYADWVAAVGTVGTLGAAVLVLRRESEDRRARQKYELSAQARQIRLSSIRKLGGQGDRGKHASWNYSVVLHNASPEAIHDVILQMRIPSGARLAGSKNDWEQQANILPHGASMELRATFTIPWPDKTQMEMPEVAPNALVNFTDSADQRWGRSTRDFRLRRIDHLHRREHRLFGRRKAFTLISRED